MPSGRTGGTAATVPTIIPWTPARPGRTGGSPVTTTVTDVPAVGLNGTEGMGQQPRSRRTESVSSLSEAVKVLSTRLDGFDRLALELRHALLRRVLAKHLSGDPSDLGIRSDLCLLRLCSLGVGQDSDRNGYSQEDTYASGHQLGCSLAHIFPVATAAMIPPQIVVKAPITMPISFRFSDRPARITSLAI